MEVVKLVLAGFVGAVFAILLLTSGAFSWALYLVLAVVLALLVGLGAAWAFRIPLRELFD